MEKITEALFMETQHLKEGKISLYEYYEYVCACLQMIKNKKGDCPDA